MLGRVGTVYNYQESLNDQANLSLVSPLYPVPLHIKRCRLCFTSSSVPQDWRKWIQLALESLNFTLGSYPHLKY